MCRAAEEGGVTEEETAFTSQRSWGMSTETTRNDLPTLKISNGVFFNSCVLQFI